MPGATLYKVWRFCRPPPPEGCSASNAAHALFTGYSAVMSDRQADVVRRHVPQRSGEERLFNRALGANLRQARLDAEMTQDQLAGRAGMTRSSIANIERGEQTPGLYRLLLLCSALECELANLVPDLSFSAGDVADSLGDSYATLVREVQERAGVDDQHREQAS